MADNAESKCPVEGGVFATDWSIYGEGCNSCPLAEKCQREHDIEVQRRKKEVTRYPYYLVVPLGLFTDQSLSDSERMIIALIYFRTRRFDHSYDKNKDIAVLLGKSTGYVSKMVSRLVADEYLAIQTTKLRRTEKTAERYRTSRRLTLGIKAVRLINLFEEEKSKLAGVMQESFL